MVAFFALIPDKLLTTETSTEDKAKFQEQIVNTFNVLACHLYFVQRVVCAPISFKSLGNGTLLSTQTTKYAIILGAGGSGEIYTNRLMKEATSIIKGKSDVTALLSHRADYGCIDVKTMSNCTAVSQLYAIDNSLPRLVVGAYSLYSQGLLPECVLDAWSVMEVIIFSFWEKHVNQFDSSRKKRLNDTRTYSAAVQIEVLQTLGPKVHNWDKIQESRKIRNNQTHSLRINPDDANTVMETLTNFLSIVCGIQLKFIATTPYPCGM